jgi:hypothetical protein
MEFRRLDSLADQKDIGLVVFDDEDSPRLVNLTRVRRAR